jgi:hypothetical protein
LAPFSTATVWSAQLSRSVLIVCLAALSFSAQASPLLFSGAVFEVTAVAATADGPAGFDAQSSPPSATPISAAADSVGTTDIATAGAIAAPGLLSTSADVSSTGGITSAVSTASFSGSILDSGRVNLTIDFFASEFAAGSGAGATSLFVNLVYDGVTLMDDFVTGLWDFQYNAAPGTTSLLSLTLVSETSAGFLSPGFGDAASSGLVNITGSVPVPATAFLVVIALMGLAVTRRGAARGLA